MHRAPSDRRVHRRPLGRHHRILRAGALAAAAVVSLAACAGDGGDAGPAVAATQPTAVGAQVSTAQTSLGEVLVDPDGLTLYAFTDDVDGVSTCFDTCATAWPPVDGDLPVADGLTASFDAIERSDGGVQLRVGGRWPLYTFAGDAGPGDVNGQASAGVWFAVAPDGTLIGLDEGAPTSTPTSEPAEPAEPAESTESDSEAAGVETELGPVLTDAEGLTLYAFVNDAPGTSNCLDPCSQTWPPVEEGTAIAPAVEDARLSVIDRADGIRQIALDGQPLYTFKDDLAPGDVNGQGVGDVWFAVAADGTVLVPPTVRVGSTDAGDVLIDPDGFTVYTFVNDRPGESACDDPCSTTWPPVPGDTEIGAGLVADQFDQITRSNGQSQLTFEGQPLYRFTGDDNPGDANGVLVGDEGTWSPVNADQVRLADSDDGADDDGYDDDGDDAEPPAAADVTVAETGLGHVLVDADGLTLYGFTNDSATASVCNGACADAWPPVPGDAVTDGAVSADVSTITRDDGTTQLVIGPWPVYRFAGDAAPGDVNGQGSSDVWFAIAPDGSLIR